MMAGVPCRCRPLLLVVAAVALVLALPDPAGAFSHDAHGAQFAARPTLASWPAGPSGAADPLATAPGAPSRRLQQLKANVLTTPAKLFKSITAITAGKLGTWPNNQVLVVNKLAGYGTKDAWIDYQDANQDPKVISSFLSKKTVPPAPWGLEQAFKLSASDMGSKTAVRASIAWSAASHLLPPGGGPANLLCDSPSDSNDDVKPMANADCVYLSKTAGVGPSLFISDKLSGASLVMAETATHIIIAHVRTQAEALLGDGDVVPNAPADQIQRLVKEQQALESNTSTLNCLTRRVVFGPEQYYQATYNAPADKWEVPAGVSYMRGLTSASVVYGARTAKGVWTLMAQTLKSQGSGAAANIAVDKVMQVWPPVAPVQWYGQAPVITPPTTKPKTNTWKPVMGGVITAFQSAGDDKYGTKRAALSGLLPLTGGTALAAEAAAAGYTGPLTSASRADLADGRASWLSQASESDRIFTVPFRGTGAALRSVSQADVQRVLTEVRSSGAADVARAEALFSPMRVATATVAAHQAVAAAAAAADAGGPAPSAAVAGMLPMLAPSTITGLQAQLAWDGAKTIGATFTVSGQVTDDAKTARERFKNILIQLGDININPLATYASVKGRAVLDIAASYDRTTNTSSLTLANVDGSYLLQLVSSEVAAYKVSLPDGAPQRAPARGTVTASATIIVTNGGLQSLSIGLTGSLTLGQIAQRYGLPWGAPDDLITVSSPSLVYTKLPASLGATMVLDIPSLRVSGITASLLVKPGGGGMQAQLYGDFSPVSGVTLSSLMLEAVNGTLTGTADGVIGGIVVTATASVTRANGTSTVSMSVTATDVSVSGIISAVLPGDLVPQFVLDLVSPMKFSTVRISYISTRRGRTPFALSAVPDTSGVPGLADVLDIVGLKPSDLSLTTTPSGSVAFSAGKTITLDLGDPFEGPAIVTFSVGIAPLDRAAVLQGSFTCTINVDVFEEPLGLFVSAEARAAAGVSGVSLGLTGATTTPINIKGLDWVTIGTLEVSVEVSLSKGPAALESLRLVGSIQVAGVTGNGVFLFSQASGAYAFKASIDMIDLQQLLTSAGTSVDLGEFNLQLSNITQSFATVDVPELDITQGVTYQASLAFAGLRMDVGFKLDSTGADIVAIIDTSEFSQAFNDQVLARLDGALQSVGGKLQDAAGAVQQGRDQALARLAAANVTLSQARESLRVAKLAFDTAKNKTDAALADAQAKVNAAQGAFDRAKAAANAALDKAKADYARADAAFNKAVSDANTALNNAKNDLNTAQNNYNAAVGDLTNKVNNAQNEVNNLWNQYNSENGQCNGYPWNWGHCVAAGTLWTAYQTATGVLNGFKASLNGFSDTVVAKALNAAKSTVNAAQATANAVLTGTQAATRATALGVLNAATTTANAVLSGTEAATLATATGILNVARATANAVLTGAEAATMKLANTAFDAAQAGVTAAAQAVDATTSAISSALASAGQALTSVRTAGFLQVNRVGLSLTLRTTRVAVALGYDITFGGRAVSGTLNFDSSISEDPKELVLNAIKGEAVNALKALFPSVAGYIN